MQNHIIYQRFNTPLNGLVGTHLPKVLHLSPFRKDISVKKFEKTAQEKKWAFAGFGAINSMIALFLAVRLGARNITIITKDLAKDFVFPTDGSIFIDKSKSYCAIFAAGIGCIFRPSSNFVCLLYTSPSPRDQRGSRMPSSA